MRVESRLGDVGNLLRLAAGRGLPDERVPETDRVRRNASTSSSLVPYAVRT